MMMRHPLPQMAKVPSPGSVVCRHAWHPHANERDCSCSFAKCSRCQVVKKLGRCPFHEAHTQEKRPSREYFESMNQFVDGIPQNTSYAIELQTALEEMGAPRLAPGSSVLEIGCGVGRLVPWFLRNGLNYTGVEPDPWAGRYLYDAYQVTVDPQPWEAVTVGPRSVDIVANVHSLEHMTEADGAFEKMVMAARRYVLLVVPEGWDIWNPDHWWMFTQDVLRTWARNMDLHVFGPVQKRVAEPEDTIYALFERPSA
jgi:SAM-dependent methyltransferase